jgi:NAD+ synthase (glutamine-hydrolysing)
MTYHGFVRVAAAVPSLRVGDCQFNAERVLALMTRAESEGLCVLCFPELCLTGYTCADLFHQTALQRAARDSLIEVADASRVRFSGLAVVGVPLVVDDQLFNCAAVLQRGRILGVVPKSYLPNYKEFYERRWFAPAANAHSRRVKLNNTEVPFGPELLFDAADVEGLSVGVEICEDLWVPIPPSSRQALQGATVLLNLSASNEVIGKSQYRRQLVVNQSGRCIAAYVYTSCGVWESTTDVVFGGHCLIAENATLLAESQRFQREETLLLADVDLERLRNDRMKMNSFGEAFKFRETQALREVQACQRVPFALDRPALSRPLARFVDPHPFVPSESERLRERCEEIFQTQMAGLAKRLDHIGKPPVAIGISGGLDSTLALLVACRTFDLLAAPRARIQAITMPGFGTTTRTRSNAHALMRELGVSPREVDIRPLCLEEWRSLGHKPFGIDLAGLTVEELTARLQKLPADRRQDLVFENVQARMRTSILMNTGFVIGTGDVSELALGWCTYNGDHMSMYNPNVSIPKTLVKFLVRWAAQNEFDGEARRILLDIVATEISPELLPAREDGQGVQSTEGVIGPYELHDFFLFHFLRYGAPPEKILYLAAHARFDRPYSPEEVRKWLQVFVKRFFANQFKRSCLQDGPKVGSISLSPRGDWRMPSDAQAAVWLEWLAREEASRPSG